MVRKCIVGAVAVALLGNLAYADEVHVDSVAGMIGVLERLRPEDSGKFVNYDGGELPW